MHTSHNKKLQRILLAAALLGVAAVVDHYTALPMWQTLCLYLVPYLLAGYDVLAEAWEGIAEADPFNENLLMSVATLGALALGFVPGGTPEFAEAVFVMLFFQVGEYFEHVAEERSRGAISSLLDMRPDVAHVERGGQVEDVAPATVGIGEIVVVRPGERIPTDATVVEGAGLLDTASLTGESMPQSVGPGSTVLSGCINLSGVLRLRVEKSFGESTASRIIELVEHAAANKSEQEAFIRRFARVYTPIVVGLALLLAVVPPFFADSYGAAFPLWMSRALIFLVVSCPCALVVSVPLSFFAGIGGASRLGILIKGGNHIDALAQARAVVIDKTGTLTRGTFEVQSVHPRGLGREELLRLAARAERHSTHPIAVSLRQAASAEAEGGSVADVEELAGRGIRATVDGIEVCAGNVRLMQELGLQPDEPTAGGTAVHVSAGGAYAGYILIADQLKEDARSAVEALRQAGVDRIVMLTGDRPEAAAEVAAALGIGEVHAALLPADKVAAVEKLLAEGDAGKGKIVFVGDGINDAPVLMRADVGLAMGALGSEAAIEAADVVLMHDRPSDVAAAIRLSRRTLGIVRQNVWLAIGVKVLVLLLAAIGAAQMWMAVFADVGVTVLAVLNAMRALRIPSAGKRMPQPAAREIAHGA